MPSGDGNVLTIHTNDGVERFRIDSSGNVKVGSACTISQDGDVFFTGVTTATTYAGSGANLTNLPAANITGTLPAISAANLTNVPAANITGTLPAISAASLTQIPAANIVGVATAGFNRTGGFLNTWVKLSSTTITSDTANVTFNNSITGAFDTYKTYAVVYTNVRPAVDDSIFRCTIFNSDGEHTTSDYRTKLNTDQGNYSSTNAFAKLTYNGVGNHVNSGASGGAAYYEDISGIIYMTGFPDRLRWKAWNDCVFEDNGGNVKRQDAGTGTQNFVETTGIRFYFDGGDISGTTNGTFTLYGLDQ